MSDFVDLCKTLLKAYTESQNDTSDDDVLKELPPIFLTTRAEFFDDDHECNRAVLVRLKLEGKLEHEFNESTAFDYITSTRDALDQCKYVKESMKEINEKYRPIETLRKGDPSSMSIHDSLLLALNGLARTNDDDIKRVFEIGESFLLSKMKRLEDTPYGMVFQGTYKERLEKCNAQLKVNLKSYAESKIEARDEELAVCQEQLKAKVNQLKLKDELLACKETELAVCHQKLEYQRKVIEDKLKAHDELIKANEVRGATLKDLMSKSEDNHEDLMSKVLVLEGRLSKASDENLKLRMKFVALKDELAKPKQASKGKPLAGVN